jgi:FkbM family methyltransferase
MNRGREAMVGLIRRVLPKPLWSRLRAARVERAVKRYKPKRVTHTYGTEQLQLEIADPLAQGWYDRDWPIVPEIDCLRLGSSRDDSVIFDLGAHQCVVAMLLARAVCSNGRVIAVEANPHNVLAGRRNLMINGISNCDVIEGAVAERSGRITFTCGLNGKVDDGTGEWGERSVRSYTVDELASIYGVPDILFVDVEGYECQVLEGSPRTLCSRPTCVIEVHVGHGLEDFGGSVRHLLSFFPAKDYNLSVRAENDEEFRQLKSDADAPQGRFFLAASALSYADASR